MKVSNKEIQLYNKFKERLMECGKRDELSHNRKLLKGLSVLVVHTWGHELPSSITEEHFVREQEKIGKIQQRIQPGEDNEDIKTAVKEAEEYLRIIGTYKVRRKCRVF
jgi:hypothetical protein